LKHSRIVDGHVRSDVSTGGSGEGDLTAMCGREYFPSPMPIYEYRCTRCRKRFSLEQSISEHGKRRPACSKCKSRAVEPMFSTFFAKTGRKS